MQYRIISIEFMIILELHEHMDYHGQITYTIKESTQQYICYNLTSDICIFSLKFLETILGIRDALLMIYAVTYFEVHTCIKNNIMSETIICHKATVSRATEKVSYLKVLIH